MKNKELYKEIGLIDEDLIDNALASGEKTRKKKHT